MDSNVFRTSLSRLPARALAVLAGGACLAAGLSAQTTLATLPGPAVGAESGSAVALIGDCNFDGVADWAIGSPWLDAGGLDAGRVTLVSGADGSVLHHFDGSFGDRLGFSVCSAGDRDGDGATDIVAGAPGYDGTGPLLAGDDHGRIVVYSGALHTVIYTLVGEQAFARFGSSVGNAGNTIGPEHDEILVGSPGWDVGPAVDAGRVSTVNGTYFGVALSKTIVDFYPSELGYAVAGVGDVDGDDIPDWAYGQPTHFDHGRVGVRSGADAEYLFGMDGTTDGDRLGHSVAGAGDLNGDGFGDLVFGSPGAFGGKGAVRVLYGPNGVNGWMHIGATNGEALGTSVAIAGDVDRDGHDDVIAGGVQNITVPGVVRILSGEDGTSMWSTITGSAPGDRFGAAVAGLGDLDGDGWLEIAVGAPGNDAAGNLAGAVRHVGVYIDQPNLGFGGPGSAFLRMRGTPLVSGGQADLTLEDAAALAPSFLVASPFQANLQVKGGVLVPNLGGAILLSFGTNALGNVALPFIPGGFGDFDVYVQFAIKDAAQVQGWSFSNALRIEFAP
jgi:hypothetical protein